MKWMKNFFKDTAWRINGNIIISTDPKHQKHMEDGHKSFIEKIENRDKDLTGGRPKCIINKEKFLFSFITIIIINNTYRIPSSVLTSTAKEELMKKENIKMAEELLECLVKIKNDFYNK